MKAVVAVLPSPVRIAIGAIATVRPGVTASTLPEVVGQVAALQGQAEAPPDIIGLTHQDFITLPTLYHQQVLPPVVVTERS